MGSENEVRSYRRANVRARVGGGGPDRRNTIRVHGAAGGVRRLRSVIQYINAVLSGGSVPAKQYYGPPKGHHQQLFRRFPSRCRLKATRSCNYAKWMREQFVPSK